MRFVLTFWVLIHGPRPCDTADVLQGLRTNVHHKEVFTRFNTFQGGVHTFPSQVFILDCEAEKLDMHRIDAVLSFAERMDGVEVAH